MEIDVLTSSFLGLRDKLHHIALNYLESDEDAKDALQDTWLKLRNGGKVETTSEARNKLVTVLRHVCIDRLRKQKPIPLDAVSAREMNGYRMEEDNGEYHLSELKRLETLLQKGLTPLQREIFHLVTHEGMEYEQVAEKLSMTVEAVRKNMSRTRKKMRETYNQLNR
jgi:RNA polymerase sigma-70 factor (ECF subfamily)